MDDLTQTISNLVGILLGLVGCRWRGLLHLRRLHVPDRQRRSQPDGARASRAMMTALAGIVLALVAYGVVELVMNAVVGSPVDPTVPDPTPEAPADGG